MATGSEIYGPLDLFVAGNKYPSDNSSFRHTNGPSAPRVESPKMQNNIIYKLPSDLHVEIFKIVLRSQWDFFHDTEGDFSQQWATMTQPSRLGTVCTHWREILWTTPVLWSDMTIVLSSHAEEEIIKLFETYLERSGECLLTIELIFEDEDDEWAHSVPERLLELFASSASRWHSINMTFPEAWCSELLELQPMFRNLKTVRIQPLNEDAALEYSERTVFNLLEYTTPVLQNLHLNGYYCYQVRVAWHQLARLSIENVDINECFHVLEKAPNLTCFEVSNIYAFENEEIRPRKGLPHEKPIPLPSMRTLTIKTSIWEDITLLLFSLYLPSLHDIELGCPSSAQGNRVVFKLMSDLLPLLVRAGATTITRLVLLHPDHGAETDLREFIWHMPLLRYLEIHLGDAKFPPPRYFVRDLLQASQSNQTHPLPNLEEFWFSGPTLLEDDEDFGQVLVDTMVARQVHSSSDQEPEGLKSLRSFTLESNGPERRPSVKVKDELEQLVADGLDIRIVCAGHSWLRA